MNWNPERWYAHQMAMLSQQLADASKEIRLLRMQKAVLELQFQTKECWLCKRTVSTEKLTRPNIGSVASAGKENP